MPEFTIVATRGALDESVHHVAAVVVDTAGTVQASIGDPGLVTYWRSASKPFQLFPLVADGGVTRFSLDAEMLALACGSHNAEPMHRAVGARWLATLGIDEAALGCGGHPSLWPALADEMVRDQVEMTPLWSNCSGKHAAMIALATLHGWSIDHYEALSHPVQQRVAESIARFAAMATGELAWGVDGCTAAAVALPIRAMATAYARLGTDTDAAVQQIRAAMLQHPEMIAGSGRLDTLVMQSWPGKIIIKIGAEGVYCAALPSLRLGIALKVQDGDMKCAMTALVAVLSDVVARASSHSEWNSDALERWRRPAIRNTRGEITGFTEARGGLTWS